MKRTESTVCLLLVIGTALQAADVVHDLQPTPDDPVARAVREKRSALFNTGVGWPLDGPWPPGMPGPVTTYDGPPKPEMPAESSDAVVSGVVTAAMPTLSEDRLGLYTEYTVRVEEVVKSAPLSVRSGDLITVLRVGGKAKLPDGHVIQHFVGGLGEAPAERQRYLFFLTWNQRASACRIVKVWEVENGTLRPNSPDDVGRTARGESAFSGKTLDRVLRELRDRNTGR